MEQGVGLGRRLSTVLRWPAGMAFTTWSYLWRITALHRTECEGDESDVCPQLPPELHDERIQAQSDGFGAYFHRRYSVRIRDPKRSAEELIDIVVRDPNRPAPSEVAVFRKVRGGSGPLKVGDDLVVRMPGPWDGPVRVVGRTPTSLRLATLRGHLEAGQIEFRASEEDGGLRFEVESWTTNGNRLADLLYDRVRLVKEMQLHMWVHYCERAAKLAGGKRDGGVTIDTRRWEPQPERRRAKIPASA